MINFTTGTINQPDSGSVGQAMVERMRDDIVAHPAWDLVEEFTPSGGNHRYYVLKCLAASSGMASDFFIVLDRRLVDGAIFMAICEDYDAATHTMSHFSQYGYYTAGVAYDGLGRIPSDYVLGSGGFSSANSAPHNYYWVPNSTSTKWWIIVYDDGFAVAFNGTMNGWMSCGVYTPLSSMPIALPIACHGNAGSSLSAQGSITRNPAAAGITYYGAALYYTPDTALGFAGDFRYNDKLQANQRPVAEIGMHVYEYNVGDKAVYGGVLGKLKHVRTGNGQLPAGLSFGDAYVLDGRLWVPPSPAEARVWDTGVPSS